MSPAAGHISPCKGQGAFPSQLPRSPSAETPSAPSSCSGIWRRPLCSSLYAFSFSLLPRLAVRAQSHGLDTTGGPGHSSPPDTRTDAGTDPPYAPTSQPTPRAAEMDRSPGHRRLLLRAGGYPGEEPVSSKGRATWLSRSFWGWEPGQSTHQRQASPQGSGATCSA